jgi:hypothetical protein
MRHICDACIYLSDKETIDAFGRYTAHVIVGELELSKSFISWLLYAQSLRKKCSQTFPYFMNNGPRILYPSALDDTRLHLLCKEARYMLAESQFLKDFNLRLVHVAWIYQLSKST